MKPSFEKVVVPAGASWALFHRRLPAFPFEWRYPPERVTPRAFRLAYRERRGPGMNRRGMMRPGAALHLSIRKTHLKHWERKCAMLRFILNGLGR